MVDSWVVRGAIDSEVVVGSRVVDSSAVGEVESVSAEVVEMIDS